ncbi:hypothetical protein SAY86_003548 [Trapa natans]|uniref:MORF/ORRM1/DAG-like MORF domain-containing protein n=1 Tax=Trapa natans TaxID=22666 RepID=A0AAN7RMW7_TRANT|nr:hypothetical protein SAY86_003548 [Trapa natans]
MNWGGKATLPVNCRDGTLSSVDSDENPYCARSACITPQNSKVVLSPKADMAACLVRVRRVLASLSAFHRSVSGSIPAVSAAPAPVPYLPWPSIPSLQPQCRTFRSSAALLLSQGKYSRNFDDSEKIDPDTILFEGCDYNHWLITMDFPKDPKPTPEEMVQTYEETCAKGLNISLEEAKKRMYACSTTTYQGFQAVMTEAESEQFRGIPGVVFILPDSYIDPQNKEYGGDKYENGMITPRPPPIQYGRQRPRNRDFNQPRYDRDGGSMQNRPGNPQYNNQGYMQRDGRNYGPPQNYPPHQNYSPPGQGDRRNPLPMNNMDRAPTGRDPPSSYQSNNNQWSPQNNYQGWRDVPQGDRRNYAPQNDFQGNNINYSPNGPNGPYGQGGQDGGGYHGQGMGRNHGQGTVPNYREGQFGQGGQNFPQGDGRNIQEDQGSYGPGGPNQGRY